jgi:hypothetical protein
MLETGREGACRAIVVWVALALAWALVPARGARALDAAIAQECIACEFPAVVSVAAQCTGVYVGAGMILTAAHCIDDVREGRSRVFFGEDIGAPAYATVIERCVRYPVGTFEHNLRGEDTYQGVDLAFCMLDDAQPLPDVPLVPPILPTGCERDWLAHQIAGGTAVLTAVGFGCAQQDDGSGEACDAGVKRHVAVQLAGQIDYTGSATKLELQRGAGDTSLMAGDSGGPYFARLPDGSWRLVALHHGANAGVSGAFAESVAPYVHWIEAASGVDVTPCHDFVAGEWLANDGCALGMPVGVSLVGGDWASDCRSPVAAAAIALAPGACPSTSEASGLVATSGLLDQAARRVLAAAPERRAARLEVVLAELELPGVFPFLASELPGAAPLASLRELVRSGPQDERDGDAGVAAFSIDGSDEP